MMRTLDEALGAVLDSFTPLGPETVVLEAALGRVLAEPFVARRDQPAFDNSAMDGWALHATGADETRVVAPGESAAGGPRPAPLASGTALRIFTGAPLPPGADTVVLQEDAVLMRRINLPRAHQHHSFASDALYLEDGTVLDVLDADVWEEALVRHC